MYEQPKDLHVCPYTTTRIGCSVTFTIIKILNPFTSTSPAHLCSLLAQQLRESVNFSAFFGKFASISYDLFIGPLLLVSDVSDRDTTRPMQRGR
jgi:hypothetical protein